MKSILVYGSLQDSVIKKITQIKKEFNPMSVTELPDAGSGFNLSSPSLFSEKRLIILENPDIKAVEKITEIIDPDLTILMKFSKTLEKSSAVLKRAQEMKWEIYVYDETTQTNIFPFLDMLGTKNKNSLREFEKNYSEFGGQYLLTMLAYFLRRMIQKPKSSSDFMRQKVESQKKNFDLEEIKNYYREIINTDFQIKQGVIEEKLAVTLLVQKIVS